MSILSTPTAQLTAAQSAAQGVRDMNSAGFTALVADFKEAFARVWLRQDGVTPQQVFDQFGTSAAVLFAGAQATLTFIESFAALNGLTLTDYLQPTDYTPPLPYTINADGTVTVGSAPAATPAH